jgi:microcystin-dependent protein
MSEPFVGEIRMFAGNFAPRGWAFCDGQLLAVSQNDALFSLLGTIYGGDGRTTFGLPDLRGRVPIHTGQGPGLSNRRLGQKTGSERETLANNQIPLHNHLLMASNNQATATGLNGGVLARTPEEAGDNFYAPPASDPSLQVNLINTALEDSGGSQPHTNLMPSLCVHFIIALFGVYPSRH